LKLVRRLWQQQQEDTVKFHYHIRRAIRAVDWAAVHDYEGIAAILKPHTLLLHFRDGWCYEPDLKD
jgi:hypothetical protein